MEKEVQVVVNKVNIGTSALKKSHIETMPYINESELRKAACDPQSTISIFCTFPNALLLSIAEKSNKKSSARNQICLYSPPVHYLEKNWKESLGVVLYDYSNKAFLFSSYRKSFVLELTAYNQNGCNKSERKINELNRFILSPSFRIASGYFDEFHVSQDVMSEFISRELNSELLENQYISFTKFDDCSSVFNDKKEDEPVISELLEFFKKLAPEIIEKQETYLSTDRKLIKDTELKASEFDMVIEKAPYIALL